MKALVAIFSGLAVWGCAQTETSVGVVQPIAPGEAGLPALFDCLREAEITLVTAHRGGPERGYPENAIATFAHTLSRTPAIIETDIRRTADGVLVLLHDKALTRTTTCTGSVAEISWNELQRCALRDPEGWRTGFHVERLEDALAWADGKTILKLDVKDDALLGSVVSAVRGADAIDRVVLITYSMEAARAVAALDPDVVFTTNIGRISEIEALRSAGVSRDRLSAWVGTRAVDERLLDQLEAADVEAGYGAFAIDQSAGAANEYRRLRALGVDEIVTDAPVTAFEALARDQDFSAASIGCASNR